MMMHPSLNLYDGIDSFWSIVDRSFTGYLPNGSHGMLIYQGSALVGETDQLAWIGWNVSVYKIKNIMTMHEGSIQK